MKAFVTAMAIMLFASVAGANHIGIFADMDGTQCAGDIPINLATDIYVLVVVADPMIVTGAEFSISHWPTESGPPWGFITETWRGLVIGNVIDGLSIALDEPMMGTIHHLGTVSHMWIVEAGMDNRKDKSPTGSQ